MHWRSEYMMVSTLLMHSSCTWGAHGCAKATAQPFAQMWQLEIYNASTILPTSVGILRGGMPEVALPVLSWKYDSPEVFIQHISYKVSLFVSCHISDSNIRIRFIACLLFVLRSLIKFGRWLVWKSGTRGKIRV